MSYTNAKGEFQNTKDITVLDSTTFTADTNGAAVEVGDRGTACLELDVSAITASDSVDVKIQTSKDGSGSGLGAWRDVAAFAQKTAVGSERKSFAGLDRFIRAVVDVTDAGGGVSVTLSVKGELKQ